MATLRPQPILGLDGAASASPPARRSAPTSSSGWPQNHEIAFCLTQPDAPAGRGRGLRPAPAKLTALQLGIPVVESLDETLDEPTIVLVAYGRLIPRELLDRHLWLNVHPSLLPRWRGAAPVERAIMAGDAETGVTVIRLVEELDAGPIAAQERFPIEPEDDAGAVYDRAAAVARRAARGVLPDPSFTPQPDEGVTYAEKIGPEDRELDLSRPEEAVNRVRALSPHIGARAELEGRPVMVWRARVEDGRFVPVEVQPAGRPAHGLRGVAPRAAVAPARRAAYEVVLRVFEDDAYADRAFAAAAAGLDARDRALAQQIAYGTVQRVRALDHGIETLGRRPVRKLDPPVRAALRLGAYQLAYLDGVAAARGGERVGRARPRGAARAGGAVHERGDAAADRRAPRAARRRSPRARSSTPTPTGSTRPGGATGARRRRSR